MLIVLSALSKVMVPSALSPLTVLISALATADDGAVSAAGVAAVSGAVLSAGAAGSAAGAGAGSAAGALATGALSCGVVARELSPAPPHPAIAVKRIRLAVV